MSALPTYFKDFLGKIRLTSDQVTELKTEHTKLRERLEKDEKLSKILVATFLQGSYRRATIVRPKEDEHADVDIIVVTTLDRFEFTPQDALELFRPFMVEHYKHQYHLQGRSIGIQLEHVDLDVVVTSAPSEVDQQALRTEAVTTIETLEEADDLRFNALWIPKSRREELGAFKRMQAAASEPEWKGEPLWIPDRDLEEWVETHPLEQIRWTRDKNRNTGTHFVNVVKAIKWWRRANHSTPKHPKSYPLEHIVGHCCPDGIEAVAEGVVRTLEAIRDRFEDEAQDGRTPYLRDHGVDQDVLKRVPGEDFSEFHQQVSKAAQIARSALDSDDVAESAQKWKELFGDEFPDPPEDSGNGKKSGFSERKSPSVVVGAQFA